MPKNTSQDTTNRDRLLAVLAAALATLAVWAIAVPLAGVDLTVRLGTGAAPEEVGPPAVLTATILAGLAGWALLSILEQRTSRAVTAWTVTALVVLMLSLAGPLSGISGAAKLTLALMHLTAGVVLIPALVRSARPSQARQ